MHVVQKMMYYGISRACAARDPHTGAWKSIAPGTIAIMQPTGGKHKKRWGDVSAAESENKNRQAKLRVITAWRYPG